MKEVKEEQNLYYPTGCDVTFPPAIFIRGRTPHKNMSWLLQESRGMVCHPTYQKPGNIPLQMLQLKYILRGQNEVQPNIGANIG